MHPNITIENVNSFCRVCLLELRSQKHHIKELKDLSQIILICTSLSADEKDCYPKYICHGCFEKLRQFHELRMKSKCSINQFSKLMEDDYNSVIQSNKIKEKITTEKNLQKDNYQLTHDDKADVKIANTNDGLVSETSSKYELPATPIIINRIEEKQTEKTNLHISTTTASSIHSKKCADYNTYIINDEEIGTRLQIEIHKPPVLKQQNSKEKFPTVNSKINKMMEKKLNYDSFDLLTAPTNSCCSSNTECGLNSQTTSSKLIISDPEPKFIQLKALKPSFSQKQFGIFQIQDFHKSFTPKKIQSSVSLHKCCHNFDLCNNNNNFIKHNNTYAENKKILELRNEMRNNRNIQQESNCNADCFYLNALKCEEEDEENDDDDDDSGGDDGNAEQEEKHLCKECKKSFQNIKQNKCCAFKIVPNKKDIPLKCKNCNRKYSVESKNNSIYNNKNNIANNNNNKNNNNNSNNNRNNNTNYNNNNNKHNCNNNCSNNCSNSNINNNRNSNINCNNNNNNSSNNNNNISSSKNNKNTYYNNKSNCFECPYCGMKKATRNELRIHINYHNKTTTKQWPCPICSKVFDSADNLTMHDRIIHKGTVCYACRYCDQNFKKPHLLKFHETRHMKTKNQTPDCNLCEKRYLQAINLKDQFLKTQKNFDDRQRQRSRFLSTGAHELVQILDKDCMSHDELKNSCMVLVNNPNNLNGIR